MARQLVRSEVDYAAVGEAGKVQNYEGEALAAIGTIIGEAISNIKPKEDKVKEQEDEINSIEVPDIETSFETPDEFEYDWSTSSTPPVSAEKIEQVDTKIEQPLTSGGGKLPPYKSAFEGFSTKAKGNWAKKNYVPGGTDFDQYEYYMTKKLPEEENKAKETVRAWANTKPKGFVYDPQNIAHVNEFKASKFYNKALPYNFQPLNMNRLKDDSPLDRRRKSIMPGNRGLAGMSNEQQFNMQAMRGATMSQLPSEASGRSFVEKQRYLRTPSWAAGTSVAAAIEGWNIGAEAANYRAQVAADAKDFQDREWKGMQAEAKQNSLIPRSFVASTKALQQKFTAAQSLPEMEKKMEILKINTQLADLERSKTMVAEGMEYAKGIYNKINLNAIPANRHDEILTFLRGGGVNAFFPNENGVMAFQGTTRNGASFSYDLDTLFDPEKGLFANLPMKVDVYGAMSTIADGIEKSDYTTTTVDADGIVREKPVPLNDLKNMIDFELDAVIKEKGLKSLAFSLPMYNNEKGLDAFNLGMRLPQDHPDHPINVVKENMSRGIHHKLTGYMSQVTEEEGKGALEDQKQRNRMEKAAYDAEQRRLLEQIKQSDPSKKRKGANEANNVKADYFDLAKAYAEKIVNNNDPKDLEDRLRAVMPEGTEFTYDSDTRDFTITTPSKEVSKKSINAEGDVSKSTTITEGQDQMLSFNRSIGDLIPVLQDLMYENNLNVSSDRQSPEEIAAETIRRVRAQNQSKK